MTYPNPVSETLILEKDQYYLNNILSSEKILLESIYKYQLFDFEGNLILSNNFYGKVTINTSKLKKGKYILRITQNEDKVDVHSIIIK
ncbi:T9SS type A sorting domain-containing protein [Flammeovirga pectinis]|uniref:T9SS type A sorting domain-containing protein n=1 Tax=Flammeovirga pectinis TaxID=2494373 RepID=A0A3S9PBH7_9BACT|nr:T9SS type A sorting domain-containing protein [Flammeovirga pectinis]